MTDEIPANAGGAAPSHQTAPSDRDVSISRSKAASESSEGPLERYVFTPPIDIYDDDNGLVLYADLPGVSLETLELQVQDNKLTIFGRASPIADSNAEVLHQEYEVGDFLRSFILSDNVDHERITASMNNGVLKVVLPKAPQSEPRRITVQTD